MSDKRMFSKTIVLSDAFLDMPMSARCLYFTLSMFGDDDGFVNSPKAIMRQCGASEDDFKILFIKKFILPFDSGLIVIKHWRINNYLRNDRYRPTKYLEEKEMLKVEENGAYTMKTPEEIAVGKVEQLPATEQKEERLFENEYQKIKSAYEKNRDYLFAKGMLKAENVNLNETSLYNLFIERIKQYGFNVCEAVIEKSAEDDFCLKSDYMLNVILSEKVFAILVDNLYKIEMPKECPECHSPLMDSSGGARKSWYCRNCNGELVLDNKKWILKK